MSPQKELVATVLALGLVFLLRSIRLIALWLRTHGALEQLSIRIAKSDGDVSDLLFLETDGLHKGMIKVSQSELKIIMACLLMANELTLTPDTARTSVDFPWATCPMVPMFWVA